jgi:hypothetical protein
MVGGQPWQIVCETLSPKPKSHQKKKKKRKMNNNKTSERR